MESQHRKETESIRKIQTDIQNKNSIESLSRRMSESEDRISDIEDRNVISDTEKNS